MVESSTKLLFNDVFDRFVAFSYYYIGITVFSDFFQSFKIDFLNRNRMPGVFCKYRFTFLYYRFFPSTIFNRKYWKSNLRVNLNIIRLRSTSILKVWTLCNQDSNIQIMNNIAAVLRNSVLATHLISIRFFM